MHVFPIFPIVIVVASFSIFICLKFYYYLILLVFWLFYFLVVVIVSLTFTLLYFFSILLLFACFLGAEGLPETVSLPAQNRGKAAYPYLRDYTGFVVVVVVYSFTD